MAESDVGTRTSTPWLQPGTDYAGSAGNGDLEFDRMLLDCLRLARGLTGTEFAAITLVGSDRLWFLATDGFDAVATDLDDTFCRQTIESGARFVVPDAHCDDSYRNARFVTGELCIRFYCGLPLVAEGGDVVGTFCVASSSPGVPLSDEDYRHLDHLAEITMDRLRRLWSARRDAAAMVGIADLSDAVLSEALAISSAASGLGEAARAHELSVDAAMQGVRQIVLLDREMHDSLVGPGRPMRSSSRVENLPNQIVGQIDLHGSMSVLVEDEIDRLVGDAAALRSRTTSLERQGQRIVDLADLLRVDGGTSAV